jgi:regulator of protease activity HflC (stomatin/prohibitin superfamily)
VSVTAEINFRYQLKADSVAVFHKFIGPGYLESLLKPEIGSQARQIMSKYSAYDVYKEREEIQKQVGTAAQSSLEAHLNPLFQAAASEQLDADRFKNVLQRSVAIVDTLVLSITLPDSIVAAINRQTEQFYGIQEYANRAAREAEESKRKQIEANGIAAFQRTVSQGISDSYLRWRGIEATLALAQSANTKIVIIGSGKDGLPIILGNVDALPSSNPGPNPSDGGTPSLGNKPVASMEKTPKSPEKRPSADSSAVPGSSDRQPSASLDLFSIKTIISELLRTTESEKSSDTGADSK